MPTSNPIDKFIEKYALKFRDNDILKKAFTHSSYVNEHPASTISSDYCNERLEFLGDAVLKICISDFLYKEHPLAREGELTKLRAQIVADKTLAAFAQKLELGECLILGAQEEKAGGRKKLSILACAFEALLGALYLEFGLNFVSEFLINNFSQEISAIESDIDSFNPKALLQEYTQAQDNNLPEYRLISQSGEAHNRTFEMGVYYNGELLAQGSGHSKKEAQQDGARKALAALGVVKE